MEDSKAPNGETVDLMKCALLVEDSEQNRKLFAIFLARIGYQVDTAANGAEGIALAMSKPYDLVVMDLQMPVMDGYKATVELRAKNFQKPIVACTGDPSGENARLAGELGCNATLFKPFSEAEFREVIQNVTNSTILRPTLEPDIQCVQAEFDALLPDKLSELRHARKDKNFTLLACHAHKLSSASMFGHYELSSLTLDLEDAANRQDDVETDLLLEKIYVLCGENSV